MSTFNQFPVPCSNCGHQQIRTIATSLNAERSPQVREAILAGAFQQFDCVACQHRFTVIIPFVYLDLERKHLITIYPRKDEPTWWEKESSSADTYDHGFGSTAPPIAQAMGKGMQVRTVFGLGPLKEKLLLFEQEIDDYVFEAYKLYLMRSYTQIGFSPECRPRLVTVSKEMIELMVYAQNEEGRLELQTMEIPRLDFDTFRKTFSSTDKANQLGSGAYIDIGRLFYLQPEKDKESS